MPKAVVCRELGPPESLRLETFAAAPLAPVPLESVSPTPRSKMRARIALGSSSCQNETLVRLGKIGACSICGPMATMRAPRSRSWP